MSRFVGLRHPSSWCSAALVSLAATLSCSSPLGPRTPVTILVTNATCVSGQCSAVHVYALPNVHVNTPAGPWRLDLGTTSAAQVCFRLPATATFRIVGEHEDQTADTTTFLWTNAHALTLSAALGGTPEDVVSATATFVPARAAGWSVTLPGNAAPVPAAACTP